MEYGYDNLFSFEAVDQGITVINVVLRVFYLSHAQWHLIGNLSLYFSLYNEFTGNPVSVIVPQYQSSKISVFLCGKEYGPKKKNAREEKDEPT